MKPRFLALIAGFALFASGCGDESPVVDPSNTPVNAVYPLISENDDPVPSDPSAPFGCCITLTGELRLNANSTYQLRGSYQNKNNSMQFENTETGTYRRAGTVLTFTRSGGSGVGFPFLLAPGVLTSDQSTVTLLYGDEGPGSNQIRGLYRRD